MDKYNYFCFVTDWRNWHYFIPVHIRDDFLDRSYDLESYSEEDIIPETQEFDSDYMKYRSMHPCNYMFIEKTVLKNI